MSRFAFVSVDLPGESKQILQKKGFQLIEIPKNQGYDPPICSHPDVFVFTDKQAVFAKTSIVPHIKEHLFCGEAAIIETEKTAEETSVRYPHDCSLNVALCGRNVIGNPVCVSPLLKAYFKENGYRFIAVKQGYAKCNVCPVSDNAIITEDEGIAGSCHANGMDVLLLKEHAVRLNGYPYGFIGGASGRIAEDGNNTVYFCGKVSHHPAFSAIASFCEKHKTAIVSLGEYPLTDFGSILFL